MIPVNKLGWMAGVLDLKCKIIRKRNKQRATPQIVLAVDSKNSQVIRELSSLSGTRPELQKERDAPGFIRKGCTEHCPEAHVHVNEHEYPMKMPQIFRWTITGASAAVIIFNVQPYLMVDNGLSIAMEEIFENTTLTGQGSGAILSSLRRLAEIGWDMPENYKSALELDP